MSEESSRPAPAPESHADELLRTVIDNLPDSIFAKDAEGRFILVNAAMARIIGAASPRELIGRTDAEIGVKMTEHYRALDERVLRAGELLLNVEEPGAEASGRPHWDLTTKVPLRDAAGAICGIVAISRDITQQKLAEQQLRAAHAQLRSAHEELRAAQAQLVEAEKFKSIGRLAAGVAHEVKNPLAIASMGLDFLAQETFAADSSVPAVLEDIRNALSRADLIVRGLLDFSDPQQLDLERHDLNAIITAALSTLRGELAGTEIQMERDLAPDLPAIPLDPEKISQVFVSLFTNAVYALNGTGRLTIRTRAEQLTGVGPNISDSRSEAFRVGATVVIAQIDDTGPGIPEHALGKIFEPFFTTKPTGKGTGLGLAVTKTIINLHGGTIAIFNRPEGGLRVELILKT